MEQVSAHERDWLQNINHQVFRPAAPPQETAAEVAHRIHRARAGFQPKGQPLYGAFVEETQDPSLHALTLVYPALHAEEKIVFILDTVTHMHKNNLLPLTLHRITIEGEALHAGTFKLPATLLSTAGILRTTAKELAAITERWQWRELFARGLPLNLFGGNNPPATQSSTLDLAGKTLRLRPLAQPEPVQIQEDVRFEGLSDSVHLSLYRDQPADYLLIVTDGERYRDYSLVQEVAQLKERGLSVALLLLWTKNPSDRTALLGGVETLASFLEEIALPWAGQYLKLPDATHRIIAGGSLGGLAAAQLCSYFPQLARCATVQSASWWWKGQDGHSPEGRLLTRWKNNPSPPNINLFVEVGSYEGYLLPWNRAFRDLLVENGTSHTYREYSGGHDYACWSKGIIDSLLYFAASG